MLKDNLKKIFEGWEDQDSPFAKIRAEKDPYVDSIMDKLDNSSPEEESRIMQLIYKVSGTGPANNAPDDVYEMLSGMSTQSLQKLYAVLRKQVLGLRPIKQPVKGEGAGPADGNSGESQSMAGSMTYETKRK
jgi:hypothetical protein